MSERQITNEFSICMLPPPNVIDKVEKVRAKLDKSPYRDDVPHITILRGITAPAGMGDEELVRTIRRLMSQAQPAVLKARLRRVANSPSPHYGISSALVFSVSREFRAYRRRLVHALLAEGFVFTPLGRFVFLPHMSLRLGVRLNSTQKVMVRQYFANNSEINFDSCSLLRLELVDGKRHFRAVTLGQAPII